MNTWEYLKYVKYGSDKIVHEKVQMKQVSYIGVNGNIYFMNEDSMNYVNSVLSEYMKTDIELNVYPKIHKLSFKNIITLKNFCDMVNSFYSHSIFDHTKYIKFQYDCYDYWKNICFSGHVKFSKDKRYDGVRVEKLKAAVMHCDWTTEFSLLPYNKTYSTITRERNTIRLHIDLDTICNNKCPYCYARQEEHDWGLIMNKNFIKNTLFPQIKKISKTKFLDVVLLGGEPTLHPDFVEVLNYIRQCNNTRVSITSNGTMGYADVKPTNNVRWAFTYHPSQVDDVDAWLNTIISGKSDWWEVAISPLIDCWGDNIQEKADAVKYVIDVCHKNDIRVQPTFQFNPYVEGPTTIPTDDVVKYYSFLNNERPVYKYGDEELNDYQIITQHKNNIIGCKCVNNNIQLTVRGALRRCCTNESLNWNDIQKTFIADMKCPLPECTCYGFLTLHKRIV